MIIEANNTDSKGSEDGRSIVEIMESIKSLVDKCDYEIEQIKKGQLISDVKLETHCFDFVMDMMKREGRGFERTDLYYGFDALHCIYKCSIDGREYEVTVKPRKWWA